MAQQPHIVVVDDDARIRVTLQEFLVSRGFSVTGAEGGAALRQAMAERPADLVLLDLNMPGEDGLSLARYLRQETKAAVIMLTGVAGVVDRVIGLEVGADDYIAKPFDLHEVLARVRSVLRRAAPAPAGAAAAGTVPGGAAPPATRSDEIRFGRFTLNLAERRLYAQDGTQEPLTSMEFDLLKALGENPNRPLNRDRLLDLAHGRGWEAFDRSIDVRIARLRRKIETDPSDPRIIQTVRGVGYKFVPDGG